MFCTTQRQKDPRERHGHYLVEKLTTALWSCQAQVHTPVTQLGRREKPGEYKRWRVGETVCLRDSFHKQDPGAGGSLVE